MANMVTVYIIVTKSRDITNTTRITKIIVPLHIYSYYCLYNHSKMHYMYN